MKTLFSTYEQKERMMMMVVVVVVVMMIQGSIYIPTCSVICILVNFVPH